MSRDDRFDDDRFDDDRYEDEFERDEDRDNPVIDDSPRSSGRSNSSDDDQNDDSSDDSAQRRGRSKGKGRGRGRSGGRDDDAIDAITGSGGSKRGYSFELDEDGAVINVKRIKRGRSKAERIDAGESWTFDPTNNVLIQSELYPNGTEVTTYSDPNKDGIFTRISESFVPITGSAAFTTI